MIVELPRSPKCNNFARLRSDCSLRAPVGAGPNDHWIMSIPVKVSTQWSHCRFCCRDMALAILTRSQSCARQILLWFHLLCQAASVHICCQRTPLENIRPYLFTLTASKNNPTSKGMSESEMEWTHYLTHKILFSKLQLLPISLASWEQDD